MSEVAKRKFQVGDRVRVTTRIYSGRHHLNEGVVLGYEEGLYDVDCGDAPAVCFYAHELELIEHAKERERCE